MIHVYATPDQVAKAAAATIAWQVASRPSGNIGLAGGTTPQAAYRLLGEAKLDWSQVVLWLGDERWVPPDHPDSNAGTIRRLLGPAGDALLGPEYELGDPHAAAAAYTAVVMPHLDRGTPDLVVLGLGDDGHTASLFPGTDALDAADPGFVAVWVESQAAWRITATLPLLAAASSLIFIVTGLAKADMVHRVLEHSDPLPAWLVAKANRNVTWLLDDGAASRLT